MTGHEALKRFSDCREVRSSLFTAVVRKTENVFGSVVSVGSVDDP